MVKGFAQGLGRGMYMTFFSILKRSSVQLFLAHINGVDDQICFTPETEGEGCLPFLNVAVQREAGRLRTSLYRKPTNTDRVLSFNSHHAWNAKAAVVHALMNRLETHFAPDDEEGGTRTYHGCAPCQWLSGWLHTCDERNG